MQTIKLLFIGIVMLFSAALVADNSAENTDGATTETINQLPATGAGKDDDCE